MTHALKCFATRLAGVLLALLPHASTHAAELAIEVEIPRLDVAE